MGNHAGINSAAASDLIWPRPSHTTKGVAVAAPLALRLNVELVAIARRRGRLFEWPFDAELRVLANSAAARSGLASRAVVRSVRRAHAERADAQESLSFPGARA